MKLRILGESFLGAACTLEAGYLLRELMANRNETSVILFGITASLLLAAILVIAFILRGACNEKYSVSKSICCLFAGILITNLIAMCFGTEWMFRRNVSTSLSLGVLSGSFYLWLVFIICKSVEFFVMLALAKLSFRNRLWRICKLKYNRLCNERRIPYATMLRNRFRYLMMSVWILGIYTAVVKFL